MCQRKRGLDSYGDGTTDVSVSVVPMIEEYAKRVLNTDDLTFEYLTPGVVNWQPGDEADFDFMLTRRRQPKSRFAEHDDYSSLFIDYHTKHYDMIILNTCPFLMMEFDAIAEILKDDGCITFKAFQPEPRDTYNLRGEHAMDTAPEQHRLSTYFVPVGSPIDDGNPHFYVKRTHV
jgi:hypothetical protein